MLPKWLDASLDSDCDKIRNAVVGFAGMLASFVLLNLVIVIAFGCCNLMRRRQILIAEQLRMWYAITQIYFGVMMFIGYPIWQWITFWDFFNLSEDCNKGWDYLAYLDFIFLQFYTLTPTLITSLVLLAVIFCFPCIIKELRRQNVRH